MQRCGHALLQFLETCLAAFLVTVAEHVLEHFSPVVCGDKGNPVPHRGRGGGVNGARYAYEIEVGNGLERREHAPATAHGPHLRVETIL